MMTRKSQVLLFYTLVSVPLCFGFSNVFAVDHTAPPDNANGGYTLGTGDKLTILSGNTFQNATNNQPTLKMDGGTTLIVESPPASTKVLTSSVGPVFFAAIVTTTNANTQLANINNSGLIGTNATTAAFAIDNDGVGSAPINITNFAGASIEGVRLDTSNTVTQTIDNRGLIFNTGNFNEPAIALLSEVASSAQTYVINNTGTIDATGTAPNAQDAITNTNTNGATVTISNSGTIIGGTNSAINNQGPSATWIFNVSVGDGAVINGDYINSTGGANSDQFIVAAGSGGSFSLNGNITNINTIEMQSGSFNDTGHTISNFNTFTVDQGAIATISGAFSSTAAGTLTNSGTINMQSNMTVSGGAGFNNNGVLNVSGTRTLPGNFTQTVNGVMAFTLTTPTTFDSLQVNGTQSIDANSFITLAINNMGSGVTTGNTFTIFRGTSPPTLPQFNNSALYIFTPRVVGNTIQVQLTSTTSLATAVASAGATPTVQNIANTASAILSNTALQTQPIVTELFLPLVNLSTTTAIVSAFNQLAVQQNTLVPTATTNAMVTSNSAQRQLFAFFNQEFRQKNEIAKKASAAAAAAKGTAGKTGTKGKAGTQGAEGSTRTPATNVSPATNQTQTQASHYARPLGFVAGDAFNYKLIYGATFYGSQERQRSRQPYDYPFITQTGGLAFVTQAAFTEKYTAGIGLSYATTFCKTYNLGAGSTDPTRIQSYQMTFMNTYLLPDNQICIEFDLSFAQNKVHQINHIFFGAPPAVGGFGIVDFMITGDYHSKQSNAQFVVSKNFPITSLDIYVIPTVLLAVNHLDRAQYVDNNPNPPAQLHSGSKTTSVILGFGASISKDQRNEKNETIVTYEGHIMGYRELHPKPTLEIDQFVGGGPTFIALGIKPFANTINLGGSITMPLTETFNFTGAYDLYLKRKYTNNAITLKINWVH